MKISKLPKVSVLVPALNEEKYIERTLTALLAQDYPDFEIIIADNGSTDQTALLVRRFIEGKPLEHITIKLVTENKRGTNFARECARRVASGAVIAQLDADCIPAANWIRKGVRALTKKKNIVAVTGPYDYFDANRWMRFSSLMSQQLLYPFINHLVQIMGRAAILIGGNAFVNASVLEEAGGYNTDLTFYGDDVHLGKQLAAFGQVVYDPSLTQASSSRRYKANGFWQVNKRYQDCFWNLVWRKDILLRTAETNHPR